MKITADMIPARYNRLGCIASDCKVTLPRDGAPGDDLIAAEVITGTMFGDSECWELDTFYMYLLTDNGELYKLYYEVPSDCDDLGDIIFEHPDDAFIAVLDDDNDIPGHWDILDLILGWEQA